jgi:hypothetical protein
VPVATLKETHIKQAIMHARSGAIQHIMNDEQYTSVGCTLLLLTLDVRLVQHTLVVVVIGTTDAANV